MYNEFVKVKNDEYISLNKKKYCYGFVIEVYCRINSCLKNRLIKEKFLIRKCLKNMCYII